MRFVLDNSVSMRWLLQDGSEQRLAYARSALQFMADGAVAWVPQIWPLEVANVLIKAQSKNAISETQAAAFVGLLDKLGIAVDDQTASKALSDTLHLARRYNLSAYDAAYLELALRESMPVATLDADLSQACEALNCLWKPEFPQSTTS
jgi:predicted nucleic acid-binding protein